MNKNDLPQRVLCRRVVSSQMKKFIFRALVALHFFFINRNGVVGIGILIIALTVILILYPRESDESPKETSKQVETGI